MKFHSVAFLAILAVILFPIVIARPQFQQPRYQQQQQQQQRPYQQQQQLKNEPIVPYDFGFQDVDAKGVEHHRQETKDEQGVVRGSYTIRDPQTGEGRTVEYVADADGFHANIKSNEPGVASHAPSNVVYTV